MNLIFISYPIIFYFMIMNDINLYLHCRGQKACLIHVTRWLNRVIETIAYTDSYSITLHETATRIMNPATKW